jgi:hypothetical protein
MDELYFSKGKSVDLLIVPVGSDGSAYVPDGSITSVVFSAKSGEFGNILISKELEWDSDEGGYLLSLEPSDTELLEEGLYSYDVSYYTSGGGFYDLISSNRLYVKRGVSVFDDNEE